MVFLSNRHLLTIVPKDQEALSAFMNFVSSNTAREAGRLHGWSGKLWTRRFDCVAITNEEAAQGVKEGLVPSPRHWCGFCAAGALLSGQDLKGIWVDRTGLFRARQGKGGHRVRPIDFEEKVTVKLSQLPCWAQLPPVDYRQGVLELAEEFEKEAVSRHTQEGTRPAGRKAVLRRNLLHRPENLKNSPRLLFNVASKAVREYFLESYGLFVSAFRAASASERFRAGGLGVEFPAGSFPPAAAFVNAVARPG